MKVTYTVPNDTMKIEAEPKDVKAVFAFFSMCSEVFTAPAECPYCSGTDIRPRYKTPKDYEYYEYFCTSCNATKPFGQYKDGNGLFAKEWEPPFQGDSGGGQQGGGYSSSASGAGQARQAAPSRESLPF